MLQRNLSSGENLPLPPPPPLPQVLTETNIAKSHESLNRLDLTVAAQSGAQSKPMFDSVVDSKYASDSIDRETR